jgi:hypothetical protein
MKRQSAVPKFTDRSQWEFVSGSDESFLDGGVR